MTATLVGDLNMGELSPICLKCLGSAGAQLQANLNGALALEAQVHVGVRPLELQLQALVEVESVIEAGIALGLPGVTFSVSAAAALVANARLALGLLGQLTALLGGPAAFVYSLSGGTVATMGADITAGVLAQPPPGLLPGSSVEGILVGAGVTDWVGIKGFFGGVP